MGIIENAKEIVSIIQKLDDTELYKKIIELEGEIIELTRGKRQLEEQVAEIRRNQDIIKNLHFDSPFYVDEEGSELYCSRCIESDVRAIHVIKTGSIAYGEYVYFCPQCENKYTDLRTHKGK